MINPIKPETKLTVPTSSSSFFLLLSPSPHTGVVSVVLAVGYLALVQVMDSREMLPPLPEAMGMGDVR